MRKLLFGLLVAGILGGAVYGAAANITLTVPNLGAGASDVNTCDASMNVAWTTEWDTTSDTYEVTQVTLTHDAACATLTGELRLTDALGDSISDDAIAFTGTSTVVNVDPDVPVSSVEDIEILVNG